MPSFESPFEPSLGARPEQSETPKQKVFEGVHFIQQQQRNGRTVYVNSDPNRKMMEFQGEERLDPKIAYTVRLVQDTKPDDPHKGKLIVELIPSDAESWQEAERQLLMIEPAHRRAQSARAELYAITNVPYERWQEMSDEERQAACKDIPKAQVRVIHRIESMLRDLDVEIGLVLEEDAGRLEPRLARLQRSNISNVLRSDRTLQQSIEDLDQEEKALLQGMTAESSGVLQMVIDDIRRAKANFQSERNGLSLSSPEAHYALALKKLRGYKDQLDAGGLVETPYVLEKKADITDHLRAGAPVMIHGHLGAGKTEVAIEASRDFSDKDPLIISGSKHLSPTEIFGHQILSLDKIGQEEMLSLSSTIEQDFKKWQTENSQASEQEVGLAHDRILQTRLATLKSGTVSQFFLGPIYRAMEEGRVIIVDEVNAIPHEILISLNFILTRKTGDKVLVQQDSGKEIIIGEGFGVLMTANLNQGNNKYVARQELDPAFLSRLYKIEYDYLPQRTDGDISVASEKDELFQVVLAGLIDRHGNLNLPENSIEKLWRLCQAARVSQNVFAGKEVDSAFFSQQGGSRALPYFLQESVLSLRAMQKILEQWKKEGFKYELDYYIYREFIGQATVPADRQYLEQLFKNRFGFFQNNGWSFDTAAAAGQTRRQTEFQAPKIQGPQQTFATARHVIDLYNRPEGRARDLWPPQVGL